MTVNALIEQARAAGVELRLVDGQVKARGKRDALARVIEPLREHKADLIRWFTETSANDPHHDPGEWRELHAAYIAHHWNCPTCCAAGQGRGLRCGTGAALWTAYQPSPHERNTP